MDSKIRIIGNYIFQDKQIKKKFLTCGIGFLGKFQGRLNYKKNVSSAIGTNHISMSTAYIDNIMGGNIFNIMVQRHVVTASNALGDCDFSQSYHMFVARKDDDKIKDDKEKGK